MCIFFLPLSSLREFIKLIFSPHHYIIITNMANNQIMSFTTSTAIIIIIVLVFIAPRSVLSVEISRTENDIKTPPVYTCNNSLRCPVVHGFNRCVNHLCVCDENFYPVYNSTTGKTYCHLCSMFQESCAMTQCCQNPHSTYCLHDMCVCKPGMGEECLGRYTPTLGIQLANTLSVSFAFVFLAITFVAVVKKTLFRCAFFRCDSMSRVASNSSLNEFIKQKMQNRPPCYDDIEKDRKVPIDINTRPPPEYSSVNFDRADHQSRRVGRYPTFSSVSDEVEMNSTPPPNYSTFTTVTDATAAASSSSGPVRNDEIVFITRPIYYTYI